MTQAISLLLPTRGRSALAHRFIASVARNAERPDLVEVVAYMDDDDPESHGITAEGVRLVKIIGSRQTMGAYNTACLKRAGGDILILGNDDVVIRTHHWDSRIREMHQRFPDGIYLGYPNDLYKGVELCAFPILSRRTCDLLGDPFPSQYVGAFIDYHLLDIFRRLESAGMRRVCYLPDVVFEHMHFRAGKGQQDETYQRRSRFADDDTFLGLRDARSAAARRLLAAAGQPERVKSSHDRRPARTPSAKGLGGRILELARALLIDHELPWRWRTRLFVWFVGRSLAARQLLPGVK